MRHLDLFSGIGGFAIAVDEVWPGSEHIFCDNNKFCQQVIHKHWPNSKIYEDIKLITDSDWSGLQKSGTEQQTSGDRQLSKITPDTASERFCRRSEDGTEKPTGLLGENIKKNERRIITNTESGQSREQTEQKRRESSGRGDFQIDLLTGGFPCQPFSQAGKRKGTEDDRYLWPEMFRVIQLAKPTWIIAENVRGLLTQSGGLVFEQVCADLENNGYTVQPFIIPAVAVNAPHRRDRIWIVANRTSGRERSGKSEGDSQRQSETHAGNNDSDAPDTKSMFGNGSKNNPRISKRPKKISKPGNGGRKRNVSILTGGFPDWNESWLEVATEFCGVDDGLPAKLDGFELSKARHRVERLKALGNAIVPQVAIEIMKAIKHND